MEPVLGLLEESPAMKPPRSAAARILVLMAIVPVGNTRAEAPRPVDGAAPTSLGVAIAPRADELERFAAAELSRYLKQLFKVEVRQTSAVDGSDACVFILGTADHVPALGLEPPSIPRLTDQGFLQRSTMCRGRPAMTIVGGSPAATLWGVYELVERYGVTYLLDGDVYPEGPQHFHLPAIDRVFEPTFRARWFKCMGDFAMGMEGWGIADYRPFLDQLAKRKFNRIRVGGCASAPFLDLRLRGLKRTSAVLWYGDHYPITADMPGRRLFGNETEFWNPDLLTPNAPCDQLIAAGQRHMHELIAYARSRGIEASSVWSLTDFSKDFQTIVPGAQAVQQLGSLTVAPGPTIRPDHPELLELGGTVIRTILDEFSDAHSYGFPVGTELPSWVELYEWAWKELDRQYGIESVLPLKEALRRAGQRADHWDGGAARSVQEVKGNITALYFLLRLWNSPDVRPRSRKPDARLIVYEVAEELWPILPRVMPRNSELNIVMDYNSTRVLRRRDVLATIPAKDVPTTMILSLHDDSVGTLPQLTTGSLHQLVGDLRKHGVNGFGTRQWLVSDHDVSTAYLARAAWDPTTTPSAVYTDIVRSVCGEPAVGPMLAAFREIEGVTSRLEDHGMGLTFPHAGMMLRQWTPEPLPAELASDRATYQHALNLVRTVPAPSSPRGRSYVRYWEARLEFAVQYFDAIETVRRGALAEQAARAARQKGDDRTYRAKLKEAIELARRAQATVFRAIDTYAGVARNRADSGAVATMAEHVWRQLGRKAEQLRRESERAP
jgi:hypothetical protein